RLPVRRARPRRLGRFVMDLPHCPAVAKDDAVDRAHFFLPSSQQILESSLRIPRISLAPAQSEAVSSQIPFRGSSLSSSWTTGPAALLLQREIGYSTRS